MVASPCSLVLAPSWPLEGACRLPLTAFPVKERWLPELGVGCRIVWTPSTPVLVRYNSYSCLGHVKYSKTSKERMYKCQWVPSFTLLQIGNWQLQIVKNELAGNSLTVFLCNTCTGIQDLQRPGDCICHIISWLVVFFGWRTFSQCCSWKQQQVHLKLVKFYWKLCKIELACSVWNESIICMAAISVLVPTAALTQACHYLLNTIEVRSAEQGPEWTDLCTEELTTGKWRCAVKAKLCRW